MSNLHIVSSFQNVYNEILSLNDNPIAPVKYAMDEKTHMRMTHKHVPLSIMPTEFYFIKDIIVDNNLQQGYELATAFGISALAAGMGFKETGGKLVTLDAYIEEQTEDAGTYESFINRPIVTDADGLKSAKFLAAQFKVESHIDFAIGWSPESVADTIKKTFGETPKIDYVFIDGGHFESQILADLTAVTPFLASTGFILFHDVWTPPFTDELKEKITNILGSSIEIVLPYPSGENMGIVRYAR